SYGGWETLVNNIVEILSKHYEVDVYCSRKRYLTTIKNYKGANLIYLDLDANGFQSIFYDFLSMWRSRNNAHVQLVLGISGCVFIPFLKFFGTSRYIVNIDGIEWRREKWGYFAKQFLKLSEMFAVKFADCIVCDNKGISDYVFKTYKKETLCIPYGGDHTKEKKLNRQFQKDYSLPKKYAFKVARIEPENNIEMILESFKKTNFSLVIVGNWKKSSFGRKLWNSYVDVKNIFLLDAIYDQERLDYIRSNSIIYIHGHSAGGTNPSLVEAMNLGLPIIAFDVVFNRYTTANQAFFFKNSTELEKLINGYEPKSYIRNGQKMKSVAKKNYKWEIIAKHYLNLLKRFC
ncbi:DUF1972 domain-containing protein, partial [Alphaproteobacteria bacterium]|nr:DUF1972 domain-containing protein [Alphaproteobacteria bacterium]